MESSDAIRSCREGNRAAFEKVITVYADRLVRVLYRIMGNVEDARDIAQEAFVRAYLNLHRFDPERPFEPWLYRIARNLAYNHMKAAARRGPGTVSGSWSGYLEALESQEKNPIEGVIDKENRSAIDRILERLRPEFREVLTLRYMERLEYEEIGARMSIPIGTVKTWLNRAKEQFRKAAEGSEIF